MEAIQQILTIPQYAFWFLLVLTLLVFVHELGHFLVARWCGVRVEVFSIGFGPELFGRTDRKGTRWRFSLVPLGGYVKMFGQGSNALEGESGAPMSLEDRAGAFSEKNVWQRIAIVFAGPLANYVFAVLVLATIYVVHGKYDANTVIGGIEPGSAAESVGLMPGDRIVGLNGNSVSSFKDIYAVVTQNLDQELVIEIEREGKPSTVTVRPTIIEEKDVLGKPVRIGRLGIHSEKFEWSEPLSPLSSIQSAIRDTYDISTSMLNGLWQMVTGVRSPSEIGGALRIAAYSGEVAKIGFWELVRFCALISINLGLINLFPIPMLDGGHLAYYGIEALTGRPLSERMQEYGLRLGITALLCLMVFATWNDLVYLNVIDYIKSLFT